uniref:Uncharacterized protein n=1 Tax=Cacopsylla melanoneura TaxID=428564 RepID=A0A8D9BP12_9HEMI
MSFLIYSISILPSHQSSHYFPLFVFFFLFFLLVLFFCFVFMCLSSFSLCPHNCPVEEKRPYLFKIRVYFTRTTDRDETKNVLKLLKGFKTSNLKCVRKFEIGGDRNNILFKQK